MATPVKTTSQKLTSWLKGGLEAIPLVFRVKLGVRREVHEGVPLDQTVDSTSGVLVETSLEQTRTNERKQTNTVLDGELPSTVEGKILFEGLEASVVRTLDAGAQTIDPDFKTVEGSVTNSGLTTEKTKATVANYPDQPGQVYDEQFDIVTPYVQKTVALGGGVGTPRTESTPIDYVKSRTRTFDITAIQAVLDEIMISYPARQDIRWPSVLESVDSVWEIGSGNGTSDETGDEAHAGTNYGFNLNVSTQAQNSGHAIPQIVPHILHPYGENTVCTDYYFFMPFNFVEADVLARLPSVAPWPKFHPVTRTFILIGQKISVTAHAAARASRSVSDSGSSIGYAQGGGYGVDIGPSVVKESIGPIIHGNIEVSGFHVFDESAGVHARASIGVLADSGSFDPSVEALARIEPYVYPATEGDFAIPSGVDVLLHVEASIYQRGKRMAVRARVAHL